MALRVLCIDLIFPDLSTGGYGPYVEINGHTGLFSNPSTIRMNKSQKTGWAKLCTALPSSLIDLRLHGFHFEDASYGLRGKVHLPSITSLYLNLSTTASLSPHSSRTFSQTFTGLKHITFPDWWCFSPEWVHRAFDKLNLESITTFNDASPHRRWLWLHVCGFSTNCRWVDSMEVVLKSQSESLVSLISNAVPFPNLAVKLHQGSRIVTFPQLISIRTSSNGLIQTYQGC